MPLNLRRLCTQNSLAAYPAPGHPAFVIAHDEAAERLASLQDMDVRAEPTSYHAGIAFHAPPVRSLIYNALVIAFARAIMSILTWLFFAGVAGSLLVILISFFEDLNELLGKE